MSKILIILTCIFWLVAPSANGQQPISANPVTIIDVNANPNDVPPSLPVFPKQRDIRFSISEDKTAFRSISIYPESIHPVLHVEEGQGDELEVRHPFRGKVAKSDVFYFDEVIAIDFMNLPKTEENDWTRLIIAAAFALRQDEHQALNVLASLSPKSKRRVEVLSLSAHCKIAVGWLDSALSDVYSIEKLDKGFHMIHLLRGKALQKKGMYADSLVELAIALKDIGQHTSDMMSGRSICNFRLKNYSLAQIDAERLIEEYGDYHDGWFYLRAAILIKKENPEYDRALEDLEYVIRCESPLYDSAVINASIVHSCRTDIKNRRPFLALKLLDQLEQKLRIDPVIKDFMLAKTLAQIETGNFESASSSLIELKKMYVGTDDIPEINNIEESILNRRHYIPSHAIPLVLEP